MNRLRFCLNDRWIEREDLAPTTTLLRFLRDEALLTGTKEGCAEGDCGACTVAVLEHRPGGKPEYRSVNSCLLLLPMIQGKHVYTVEALCEGEQLHPAQRAMADCLGSQCGYCTPGFVMSLFETSYRHDLNEPWQIDDALCGNLCRCTGYRPIRDAAQRVAGTQPPGRFIATRDASTPPKMELGYQTATQRFITPVSLPDLWTALDQHPQARFIAGGTDLALEVTKRYAEPPLLISVEGLSELGRIEEIESGWRVGATIALSELEQMARTSLPPVERMLRYFGARQIKNRGTVGGNVCNASPIGDLPPVLISLGATAVLCSREGQRRVPLEEFFVAYRKTARRPKEILGYVEIPRLAPNVRACAYKVSKRRELDISCVAAGFLVEVDDDGRVARARLAYGGMAATPKRADAAEAVLVGNAWSAEQVETAVQTLGEDFRPLDDHRGSARYRLRLAQNLLRGFFDETSKTAVPRLHPDHSGTVEAS